MVESGFDLERADTLLRVLSALLLAATKISCRDSEVHTGFILRLPKRYAKFL